MRRIASVGGTDGLWLHRSSPRRLMTALVATALTERMSTDPEAVVEVATRRCDLLVIYGDHSFAGVAADFRLYAPLVKIGGYVLFDDYAKPEPDVQAFVDAEMPKRDWCVPVGSEWTSAAFRVVGKPPGSAQQPAAPGSARQ